MKKVYNVSLMFDIMFDDAESGSCWAGDGERLVKLFSDGKKAESFVSELNPIINAAEKEHTIVPKQPNNKILKEKLGFDLHDLNQGNENYRLEIRAYDLED